jgi:hypothetical protein
MAARVVADETKVLNEGSHLSIQHIQRGAEGIRQHEHGRALGPRDFDMDRTAGGVDQMHGFLLALFC